MATPKPRSAPLPALAAMADELGALEKEYAIITAPFALKLKRMKVLEDALRLACPAAADVEWRVMGERFEVVLGPCAQWRIVDIPKLLKLVGMKLFTKIATVSLKTLEANVSAEVLADVTSKGRIGPRTLKTFEKGN